MKLFLFLMIFLHFINYTVSLKKSVSKTIIENKISSLSDIELKQKFENFKLNHKKIYKNEEEAKRFEIYKLNLIRAEKLQKLAYQKNPKTDVIYGETAFVDLTVDEFMTKYTGLITLSESELTKYQKGFQVTDSNLRSANSLKGNTPINSYLSEDFLPENFNWITSGKVSPVKDQKQCGSCWAFATCALLECAYAIKYNKILDLSEQQFVDCSKINSKGCQGGSPLNALDYAQRTGVDTETSYPYTALNGQCKFNRKTIATYVNSFTYYQNLSPLDIMKLLTNGGLLMGVNVTADFQLYKSGVMEFTTQQSPSNQINHAVFAVGYEKDSQGRPVWKVKNSWNLTWGENGFYRILGEDPDNPNLNPAGVCGSNSYLISATVK